MEPITEKKITRRHNSRIAAGIILIVFGAATLLQRWLDIGNYIVLLLGLGMLIWGSLSHKTGLIIPGGIMALIGGTILVTNGAFRWMDLNLVYAAILIVVGLILLVFRGGTKKNS